MLRVVSGGQTGVDRGALDGALACGAPCGGWCPAGRIAEDGVIQERYPLRALMDGGYEDRTRKNVEDSDATLVISFGQPEGGTALTIDYCREIGKPCLLIDALQYSPSEAAGRAIPFIDRHDIINLNVAGPRASSEPDAYGFAKETITFLLKGSQDGES